MRRQPIALALTWIVALALLGGAHAGTISGTVKYEGQVPKLRPLKMDADPGCMKMHSSPAMPEVLVLGEGNTLGNIFVRVKSGLPNKDYPAPSEPAVLDQQGCKYTPHVLGLMVGQPFKVLNSDGLLHNVHALPNVNTGFNRAMPATVKELDFVFDKEEFMFKIKCDVHPWMGAWIAVMTHPFFDVTGKDGKYEIKTLPAGTYEIEIWHERLKTRTQSVTISGDETKTVDFTMSRPSS